jgi:hypothetical protein
MTTNRVPTLFILGGGRETLLRAKRCGAVHIDHYSEVDPQEVDGGIQAHVEDKTHALLLLDTAERIFVYPEFADLLPHLPKDKVVLIARRSHPLCGEYACAEEPPC